MQNPVKLSIGRDLGDVDSQHHEGGVEGRKLPHGLASSLGTDSGSTVSVPDTVSHLWANPSPVTGKKLERTTGHLATSRP